MLLSEHSTALTTASSLFDRFVLDRLRRAHIRARIILNEIDAAGIALRDGWIDGEGALAQIAEAGLLPFVVGSSS